jgi:hypothetical protein
MKPLIPLSYINEACFVSLHIDDKKMEANLQEAQEDLKAVLGVEFYDEIESQYDAAGGSFGTDNETLYEDYIKKYLAWQAYLYHLGFSQSDSTATGQREFNDANSTLIADVKLYSFEKNVRRRATKYKFDIINYLKLAQSKDSTKFPKWIGYCENEFGFAISSISKKDDHIITIDKIIKNNE